MKAIQLNKKINEIFSDKKRDITEDRLKSICKMGQGGETCRYIMRNRDGYSCMKNSVLQVTFDGLVSKNSMVARGNNCPGLITPEEYYGEKEVHQKESFEEKSFEEKSFQEGNQKEGNQKEDSQKESFKEKSHQKEARKEKDSQEGTGK